MMHGPPGPDQDYGLAGSRGARSEFAVPGEVSRLSGEQPGDAQDRAPFGAVVGNLAAPPGQ